jgi:hypothetical protein
VQKATKPGPTAALGRLRQLVRRKALQKAADGDAAF